MRQFRITLLVDVIDLSDEKLAALDMDACNVEGWQKAAGLSPMGLGQEIADTLKSSAGNDIVFEGSDYYVEITEAKCECVEVIS